MNYKTYRVGSICSMIKGTYPTLKTEPGEYPLVVTADYRRSASTYQLEGPAVCVPLISSTGHGDAALHRVHYQEDKFALANLLVALLPQNLSLCDAKYLYYLLMAKKDEYFVPLMTGTANVSLKIQDIADVEIPLPSIEEQHRIVARIEELTTKIEEARGLRREAVEEVETLFPSALESLFEGNNAKCWTYGKLARNGLAMVVAGQHIMAGEYNLSGDGFPYLTGPADFGARVAEIKRWTLNPKSIALPSDILLTVKGAGVGKINLAPDVEVAIGRQLMAIRPNTNKLLHEFVYFFLEHKFKHFQSIATATTVPGFKKTDVEELRIPVPNLAQQHHIVAYLDSLQAKVDSLKQLQSETTTELDALLPSILDKAFKGEL
jgi:type I restriction enzyme, S subunit